MPRTARALSLAALLTLLFLCTPPAHATKRTVVLVADLAASDVKASEAATISDLLRGELARERKFVLVQRGEMEAIAEELQFQMSGCTEQGCAVQMGQMLNAEKVIVGRVAKLFGRLTISAQVVDMTANDIEFAEKVDCEEDYAAVAAAIATLARKLSAHVPILAEVKGVAGDVVVLDGGSREGLASGQRLTVLRGVVVKDAQGRPLMEKRQTVGEVEITYADARDSEARILSGQLRPGDYARVGTLQMAAGADQAPAAPPGGATGGDFTDPLTGMEFVCIDGGSFQMGDVWGDGDKDERPAHPMAVADFCIGKTEVTQAQWEAVMGSNPSRFKGADRPVEQVSWNDVQQFVAALERRGDQHYRLPTEAEWEYAARSGGKQERFAGTSRVSELGGYAWYDERYADGHQPVAQKKPNALGLYDMNGNVWEWVQDEYGEYPAAPQSAAYDPERHRVLRGGGWFDEARFLRSTNRTHYGPVVVRDHHGFRLVVTP